MVYHIFEMFDLQLAKVSDSNINGGGGGGGGRGMNGLLIASTQSMQ